MTSDSSAPPPRTILITGAGSGVGRGLAESLAAPGRHLVLADLHPGPAAETAAAIAVEGCTSSSHGVDVSSSEHIERLIRELAGRHVDVVINNAGLQHVAEVAAFPEPKWDALIDVMLKGPFLLSKAFLPQMREHGFGRIINIGSIHSLIASPFKSAYVSAKHGLVGLTKVIALETAKENITANCICPSYVRTPLVDSQIRSQAQLNNMSEQDVIDRIMLEPMPKKAFITVGEIAATVEFLMSDGARNITGQSIAIDGGWTSR